MVVVMHICIILFGGAIPVESQWQIDCSSPLAVIILTRWNKKKVGIDYSSNHLVVRAEANASFFLVHDKQVLFGCSFYITELKCLNICSVRQEMVLQTVDGHLVGTTH